mgnify:CR=1 FL=1
MEFDIIVIGGGIAGLSAALTAARLGRSVGVISGGVPGGELLNIELIDGLPGHEEGIAGFDLCPIAMDQATAAGAEIITETAETISSSDEGYVVLADGNEYAARALILAMGAHVAKLGVPGEEEFTGRGVSHCATCDGPLLRGKTVVVAGGGDSGMQEALTLAQHVEKVLLVERGEALSGQASYVEAVEAEPAIEVMTGMEVTAISGADKLEQVILKEVSSGAESTLEVQGLFAFVGLEPNLDPAADLVELADDGRIAVDGALRTSAKGVFAVGNLRSGNSWRAAGAMGDGATAAVEAARYLDSGAW